MTNLAEQIHSEVETVTHFYRIGNLYFDSNLHTLSSNNRSVYLRHQLNHVLLLLVQNSNRGISRDEIINQVWNGNQHTGQKALTHTICKLRSTLEDLAKKDVTIMTIPKFGYSLVDRSIR